MHVLARAGKGRQTTEHHRQQPKPREQHSQSGTLAAHGRGEAMVVVPIVHAIPQGTVSTLTQCDEL